MKDARFIQTDTIAYPNELVWSITDPATGERTTINVSRRRLTRITVRGQRLRRRSSSGTR
jgi:hypothetical protein